MVRVMTLGTFDLFHAGHVALLAACRRLAGGTGTVIVGLNTDAFVARYKGRRPVVSYEHRRLILESCRYVTYVQDNPLGRRTHTQADGIEVRSPDIIAVGSDWRGKDYLGQLGVTQSWLDERGIKIHYIPRPDPPLISTSVIRSRVVADYYERNLVIAPTP